MGGAMVPQLRDPTIPPMVNLDSESIGGVEASSELQSLISAMAGFSPDAGGMDVFYMESELIQPQVAVVRSEEHTYEPQSIMRTTYAVFCLKKETRERENTIAKVNSD